MTNIEVLPSELAQEVMSMAELHHARIPIPSAFCFGLGEWLRRPFFVMAGAEGVITLAAIWTAVIYANFCSQNSIYRRIERTTNAALSNADRNSYCEFRIDAPEPARFFARQSKGGIRG